jgi:hypothetical protein
MKKTILVVVALAAAAVSPAFAQPIRPQAAQSQLRVLNGQAFPRFPALGPSRSCDSLYVAGSWAEGYPREHDSPCNGSTATQPAGGFFGHGPIGVR